MRPHARTCALQNHAGERAFRCARLQYCRNIQIQHDRISKSKRSGESIFFVRNRCACVHARVGCRYPGIDGGQKLLDFEKSLIDLQLQVSIEKSDHCVAPAAFVYDDSPNLRVDIVAARLVIHVEESLVGPQVCRNGGRFACW